MIASSGSKDNEVGQTVCVVRLAAVLELESFSKTMKRYDFHVKDKTTKQTAKRSVKRVPKRIVLGMVWNHLRERFGRAFEVPSQEPPTAASAQKATTKSQWP